MCKDYLPEKNIYFIVKVLLIKIFLNVTSDKNQVTVQWLH